MLKQLIEAICFRLIHGPLQASAVGVSEISKLEIKAGDFLVVKVKQRLSSEQVNRLKADLEGKLPAGIKVLVFEGDVGLSIVSAPAATFATAA